MYAPAVLGTHKKSQDRVWNWGVRQLPLYAKGIRPAGPFR